MYLTRISSQTYEATNETVVLSPQQTVNHTSGSPTVHVWMHGGYPAMQRLRLLNGLLNFIQLFVQLFFSAIFSETLVNKIFIMYISAISSMMLFPIINTKTVVKTDGFCYSCKHLVTHLFCDKAICELIGLVYISQIIPYLGCVIISFCFIVVTKTDMSSSFSNVDVCIYSNASSEKQGLRSLHKQSFCLCNYFSISSVPGRIYLYPCNSVSHSSYDLS